MTAFTITLPWPACPLWANDRRNRFEKARAIKAARHYAWVATLESGARAAKMTRPKLTFQFHPRGGNLPDLHNMPHTMKAAIDGIADALGINDKHILVVWPMEWSVPVKGGLVTVGIKDVISMLGHNAGPAS